MDFYTFLKNKLYKKKEKIMAHNLHLMVVKATSGQDACNIVENEIIDFGDDNNWRTVCGAISEKNEVHIEEENGWMEDMETVKKINAEIRRSISFSDNEGNHDSGRDLLNALIKGEKTTKDLGKYDWYNIKNFANDMSSRLEHDGRDLAKDFDILKGDDYKFGHYDEFGVTQFMGGEEDDEPKTKKGKKAKTKNKKWIVFIDMHS
jgi:hypothetical protein